MDKSNSLIEEIQPIFKMWRSLSYTGKLLSITLLITTMANVASIGHSVHEIKGFLLSGIEFYRVVTQYIIELIPYIDIPRPFLDISTFIALIYFSYSRIFNYIASEKNNKTINEMCFSYYLNRYKGNKEKAKRVAERVAERVIEFKGDRKELTYRIRLYVLAHYIMSFSFLSTAHYYLNIQNIILFIVFYALGFLFLIVPLISNMRSIYFYKAITSKLTIIRILSIIYSVFILAQISNGLIKA